MGGGRPQAFWPSAHALQLGPDPGDRRLEVGQVAETEPEAGSKGGFLGAANAEDPGGRLVRRLKAGDPAVPALAARLILKGLVAHERQLRRHGPRVEIIPAPGHEPGPAGSPLHHICLELTAAAPWLYYRPGRLVRATEIRSSRASTHRPSIDEHLATLVCVGRPMVGSIIIDDVFSYGNSSEACRAVLRGRRTQTLAIACLARAGG